MKKVSAFSVFKGKKDKGDTPTIERNSSKRGSIKKASSEPVINGEDDSKSKKLLRAIKGGSFRNTVRGNKHRPANLADGTGNSPFVAGDSSDVKLTAVKGKNKKEDSVNTSLNGTPALPKKSRQSKANVSSESLNGEPLSSTEQSISQTKKQSKKQASPKQADTSKSSKQKKALPPLPVADFTETREPAHK
ncbi:uncharacterized protein LOC128551872 [Mercenaria mercenaria]|uniref:uncharacterized protein LOC128551872 n=1 Tax=Mercenaria mercenaria TaxID=6596 RepID=UPI00234F3FE1|nr:uncharacterized protein LOC128551872 [Mercenaria mercenaria]